MGRCMEEILKNLAAHRPASRGTRATAWPRRLVSLDTWRATARCVLSCLPEVTMRLFWVLVVVWLLIGLLAAWQRHDFTSSSADCSGAGTIVATAVFGPANYFGADPKLSCH